MSKGVIIQASSRTRGHTSQVVSCIEKLSKFNVINLLEYSIEHFDYEFKNKNDDFNALFKRLASNYEIILFATPVYWYTMSGICKVFMDRMSDFLFQEKDYGRLLRGKQLGVISCGSDHEIFDEFDMPFRESARYLGMSYLGHVHTWLKEEMIPVEVKERLEAFIVKNSLINKQVN